MIYAHSDTILTSYRILFKGAYNPLLAIAFLLHFNLVIYNAASRLGILPLLQWERIASPAFEGRPSQQRPRRQQKSAQDNSRRLLIPPELFAQCKASLPFLV